MDNGSEAEEALQCTGVVNSIRKLTARMTIFTPKKQQLVTAWQKQHPYELDIEGGTCDHICADGSFFPPSYGRTHDQIWQHYDRTGQDKTGVCVCVCVCVGVWVSVCVLVCACLMDGQADVQCMHLHESVQIYIYIS